MLATRLAIVDASMMSKSRIAKNGHGYSVDLRRAKTGHAVSCPISDAPAKSILSLDGDTPFWPGKSDLRPATVSCSCQSTVLYLRHMNENERALRKRMEEARLRHAAIVESSDDAIIGTDTNGTVMDWNKGAERLFGYSASEAIGQKIFFLTPTDRREEAQHIFKKVIHGEVVKHYETMRQKKDGTRVEISLTVSPIVDTEGRIVGASGIARDITERRKAEERLREYEKAVEGLDEMIVVVDREYRFLIANRKYVDMRKMTKEQIEGHFANEVVNAEMFETVFKEKLDESFQGKVVRFETKYPYPALGERNIAVSYFPIEGTTGVDRVAGIIQDITERKLAEERVRTSEERLRLAQWAAHIGTFDLNLRTGVDVWTPETEALYGLPPGGFGGTLTAFENLIHPDDRKRVIELSKELIRTGRPVEAEWRVVWPDGSVHWIAARSQVLMDESGEPSRMVGVNMDITERKKAEEALSGMTRKLVEAQEQERTRIARELHDDINQRLALLALELNQLREKHNDLPSEARDHVFELQLMTADLCSRVYALSHELHFSTLDLLGLLKGMRSWCKSFGERHKIEIDFKNGDVPKLSQEISLCLFRVLQEAVHNAAKHSGVKRIDVQLAENSGEIHLIVSDSGKGFDIEAASQNRRLGLTSMQERVRLVGGTIAIESKPMGGTAIRVRVPIESKQLSQRATV
jgi:PAS domain S-box-containing protein